MVGKATKKFKVNHLARVIEDRKHKQKIKQSRSRKEGKTMNPKQQKRLEELEASNNRDAEETEEKMPMKMKIQPKSRAQQVKSAKDKQTKNAAADDDEESAKGKRIEEMDADEFLEGNFFDESDDEEDDEAGEEKELNSDDSDFDLDAEMEGDENDSESSADEDEELDEAALEREIAAHEESLKSLASSDPEFYKHLKSEDPELLKFSTEGNEHEDDDGEDGDSDDLELSAVHKLTPASWAALKDQLLKSEGISSLKKGIKMFRTAAHIHDSTEEATEKAQLKAANSKLFIEILRFSMKELPMIFHKFLPADQLPKKNKNNNKNNKNNNKSNDNKKENNSNSSSINYSSHPRWKSCAPLLKSFIGNYLHFLQTTVENKLLRFSLNCLESIIPFIIPFPKFVKKLIKSLLKIWATAEKHTRIDAFLRIRQLAISFDEESEILEEILKGSYLTFIRNCRFSSGQNHSVLEFMLNSVVELFAIDLTASYQHAFVYVRQLAIHVRNAMLAKESEGYKSVYNWQFIWALRMWGRLLSLQGPKPRAGKSESPMHALIYPFVQVALAVLNLLPATRYFPLRIHVAKILNDLSAASETYIPLSAPLLSVLDSVEFTRQPTNSSKKATDIAFVLKVSKLTVATRAYQEQILNNSLEQLMRHFTAFSYSIAFPELVLFGERILKKFSKLTKIHRIRKQIQLNLTRIELNKRFILNKRSKINYSPRDMALKNMDSINTFKSSNSINNNSNSNDKNEELISPLEKFYSAESKGKQLIGENESNWDVREQTDRDEAKSTGKKQLKSKSRDGGEDGEGDDGELPAFAGSDEDEEDKNDRKKENKKRKQREEEEEFEEENDDAEDEEDEEEEEEERPAKKSKSGKDKKPAAESQKKSKKEVPAIIESESDDQLDDVQDLVFSDEDQSD